VYLEQKRLEEARYELEGLLDKECDLPLGLLTMAGLLVAEGRPGEAAGYFQAAVMEDEENAAASLYYKLGISYYRIGRFKPAETALMQAAARNPALTEAYMALGNIFFDLAWFAEAVEQFETARRRRPDTSNLYNPANAYAEAGRDDKAIKTYKTLLSSQPEHKRALNNMGNVFFNRKQYEKAIVYYERALRIDPQFAVALQNMGDIYSELKDNRQASDYYKKSLLFEQDSRLRALLEEKLKNVEEKGRPGK
jgi:tetratricopeptide (TPR) repeat protein